MFSSEEVLSFNLNKASTAIAKRYGKHYFFQAPSFDCTAVMCSAAKVMGVDVYATGLGTICLGKQKIHCDCD